MNKVEQKSHNLNYMQSLAYATGGVATAAYGLRTGMHRALGLRLERHYTTPQNAKNIIQNDCVLLPNNHGFKGFSRVSDYYRENSKGFIHITGFHNSQKHRIKLKFLKPIVPTLHRKMQYLLYKSVSSEKVILNANSLKNLADASLFKKILAILKLLGPSMIFSKIKTFYIAGTDSYFTKNFTPDPDDFALKTDKPLKVYRNRLSAIIEGLKKFGLKGVKENKVRVVAGIGILISSGALTFHFIKKALNSLNQK